MDKFFDHEKFFTFIQECIQKKLGDKEIAKILGVSISLFRMLQTYTVQKMSHGHNR